MNAEIRTALATDASDIAELSHQLGYPSTPKIIKERLNALLANNQHRVWVIVKHGQIVGWVHAFFSLRVESNSFVEIGGLVVNQNQRGQGLGKQLVAQCKKWAHNLGCETIRVRSNSLREETHTFYKNIGFEIKKKQHVFEMPIKF